MCAIPCITVNSCDHLQGVVQWGYKQDISDYIKCVCEKPSQYFWLILQHILSQFLWNILLWIEISFPFSCLLSVVHHMIFFMFFELYQVWWWLNCKAKTGHLPCGFCCLWVMDMNKYTYSSTHYFLPWTDFFFFWIKLSTDLTFSQHIQKFKNLRHWDDICEHDTI